MPYMQHAGSPGRHGCRRPALFSVAVQVRYRYRIYPAPGQQQALARVFGCARVVYNDCLRVRDAVPRGRREDHRHRGAAPGHHPGQEAPRNVPGWPRSPRSRWCRRARTPAAPTGTGSTRCPASARAEDRAPAIPVASAARQSIRLTRNGFALHGERLYVAKVGDIRVAGPGRCRPSRPVVTVIHEPDGRYYASFVVEREATPLPACGREVGVDLGLTGLAVTSDGEMIANPRFLRAKAAASGAGAAGAVPQGERLGEPGQGRRTGRGRAPQGPRDPARPRAQDGSSAGPRQPSGLRRRLGRVRAGRTRLAKSVHDAGWAQFAALAGEKAAQYGRTFARIGRFGPTSQMCSACGHQDGPKPLAVRAWTCPAAGRSTTGTSTRRRTSWPPGGPTG